MTRLRGKSGNGPKGAAGAGGPGKSTPASPASPASSLLKLQRTAGNDAVAKLMGAGSGLAVSQPGDLREQEAERMAERAASPGPASRELPLGEAPVAGTAGRLAGLGPGRPLDPEARALLEPRFGRDFAAVRVHDDRAAAEAARAVEARAFTVGKDLVFDSGQYAPDTAAGRRLLAHELTHVVQQSAAGSPPLLQRSPWDVKPPDAQSSRGQAGPWTPLATVEIGAAEAISGDDPRLAELAGTVQGSLALFPGAQVQITGFWEAKDAQGAGVDAAAARQRAERAKAALARLGVPSQRMLASVMASQVLSNPAASPGGLVRIALFPTGFQQPAPGLGPAPASPPGPRRVQPTSPPSPPAASPAKPPGSLDEEAKPRQGTAGDAAKAVLELPPVKQAIDKAKEQATEAWNGLSPAGKAALITGAVAIGAGAAAGIASQPGLRDKALQQLHGLEIPIPLPGVPGKFSVKILTQGGLPKFDPHAPSPKPEEPVGPGAILRWTVEF